MHRLELIRREKRLQRFLVLLRCEVNTAVLNEVLPGEDASVGGTCECTSPGCRASLIAYFSLYKFLRIEKAAPSLLPDEINQHTEPCLFDVFLNKHTAFVRHAELEAAFLPAFCE